MKLLSRIRNRRRCQFGIKSLLLFMTITSAGLAPLVNRAREQGRIVGAIRRGGGECLYSHQYRRRPGDTFGDVDVTAKPQWPKWLLDRTGLDLLESVVVVVIRGELDANATQAIGALRRIEELYVVKPELRPSDVHHLSALTGVRLLYLQLESPPDYDLLCQLPQSDVIPFVVEPR